MNETLKILREKNKLSQASVAEYLGISRQMYLKYEAGENEPTVNAIIQLSKLYKVSYDVLIDNKLKSTLQNNSFPQDSYFVSSPTPAYSSSLTKKESIPTIDFLYLKKWDLLSPEQKTIVKNLIDSLSLLNKPIKKKYREVGGLTGEFYMAEDFDETPDCFKEYM